MKLRTLKQKARRFLRWRKREVVQMSVALRSKAQSLASDLSLLDDVFHLIDRRREERDRIAAIYRGGLLKSYSDGRVSCECEVSIDRGAHKWNFVFRATNWTRQSGNTVTNIHPLSSSLALAL
jgi:hypothetical protein